MKRITFLAAFLILLATAIYSIARQSTGSFVPVTDVMLENPDPADWLMWRRTLNSWGYSPLDQINATNVRNMRMVWTRGMGPGIQEATPLVYRGVMYLPNPSDLIQSMNAATGDLIWEYKREWAEDVTKILPVPLPTPPAESNMSPSAPATLLSVRVSTGWLPNCIPAMPATFLCSH